MKAVEQLEREHVLIRRALQLLLSALEPFDEVRLAQALNFCLYYNDRVHYPKEEKVLFPEVMRRARAEARGPIQALEKEHALAQAYARRAQEALPDAGRGEVRAKDDLVTCVQRYVELMRRHLRHEQRRIYSKLDQLLPPSMDADLLERFEAVVAARIDPESVTQMEGLVHDVSDADFSDMDRSLSGISISAPAPIDMELLAVEGEGQGEGPGLSGKKARRGRPLYEDERHLVRLLHDFGRGLAVQANQYLIIHEDEGMVLDPGGPKVYANVLAEAMLELRDRQLRYVFLSHQDPDACTSLNAWLTDTTADVYVSELWIRFLPHFGVDELLGDRLKPIPDGGMRLGLGGEDLLLIPAHFMHSCGNFHVYDPTSRVLFTGDLGASMGVAYARVGDFDQHLPHLQGFHRRYMASREVVRAWVRMVRELDIEVIAPQHGAYIQGRAMVRRFLDWCDKEACGFDLLEGLYRLPTGED